MKKKAIESGESLLRPRARIIKTIGEELISSDKVAILELVKNSYDADAEIIVITFTGEVREAVDGRKKSHSLDREGSRIVVFDDGEGMDLETIRTAWMEPATVAKKSIVESRAKGRRLTGEKGIGRFSSARLGSVLKITTRKKGENEIFARFDWEDFDDPNLFLDEVKCSWVVREPEVFIDDTYGTQLEILELNSTWSESKFRDLRITLQRLVNPVKPVEDFLIELQLPKEFKRYSGTIEPPESLRFPMYSVSGKVNADGFVDANYSGRGAGTADSVTFSLLDRDQTYITGPFSFKFDVWDRDLLSELAENMGVRIKDIRQALNALAGVSIYRDGFRVLPYGEPKVDWLGLDLRRVNNPTLRLSNNQIIGFVELSLESNPSFTDQSNREGIVASDAFDQLRQSIISILAKLEERRYAERPRRGDDDPENKGLFSSIDISRLVELIREKLAHDKDALSNLSAFERSYKSGTQRIRDVLARYRRLSTLGVLLDVVLHDGNNFLAHLDSELLLVRREINSSKRDINKVNSRIDTVLSQRKVLSQLFKRLEPFGGRKKGKPKEIVFEEALESVFQLFDKEIDELDVQVTLPTSRTLVRIDESELQIIFVNLLQNSLYWMRNHDDSRRIIVEVTNLIGELEVIFSDSGPGIPENLHHLIFDPYFSTKPDGIGLGLTIVGEILSEYGGELNLIDGGPLPGATLELVFRKRV
ncbi:MAG: hypothetical protein DWQ47_11390 [Acidobacteria bacterium]|nr:MAG: hypothetical protein DWQ32_13805 [Acidobacteriota bacterium]REJ98181.1 MAG: hypothetical protein DWQ38_16605 [Acidobacteriota bacterium]REK16924.1 MAG: hypothetical protein DWQ43_01650 [Acidobacteriota bacterium]REK42835.1 MAG: hypothetical protein DWQ47_11390 [Acidobacteriota bacterium]